MEKNDENTILGDLGDAFAFRLRTAREKAGLSLGDLSKIAGVSKTILARWEAGEGDGAGIKNVAKVAYSLKITPAELAYGVRPSKAMIVFEPGQEEDLRALMKRAKVEGKTPAALVTELARGLKKG